MSRIGMVEVLRGEDRLRPRSTASTLREHLAFEVEILEHRLDHQVGAGEAAVVGGPGSEGLLAAELGTRDPTTLEPLGEQRGRPP